MASVGGVLLGVEAARRENSFYDRLFTTFALLGHSFPSFSIGHLLLLFFALYLGLFPAQGMTSANQDLSGIAYFFQFAGSSRAACADARRRANRSNNATNKKRDAQRIERKLYHDGARQRRFRAQSFIWTRAPQRAAAGCNNHRQRFGNAPERLSYKPHR